VIPLFLIFLIFNKFIIKKAMKLLKQTIITIVEPEAYEKLLNTLEVEEVLGVQA